MALPGWPNLSPFFVRCAGALGKKLQPIHTNCMHNECYTECSQQLVLHTGWILYTAACSLPPISLCVWTRVFEFFSSGHARIENLPLCIQALDTIVVVLHRCSFILLTIGGAKSTHTFKYRKYHCSRLQTMLLKQFIWLWGYSEQRLKAFPLIERKRKGKLHVAFYDEALFFCLLIIISALTLNSLYYFMCKQRHTFVTYENTPTSRIL